MNSKFSKTGLPENILKGYLHLLDKFNQGPSKIKDWNSIQNPDPKNLVDHESLEDLPESALQGALGKLVVGKLNGGLGTSMGCSGPKSLIEVKEGKSFLGLILEQLESFQKHYGVSVPLLLMNSFYTQEETQQALGQLSGNLQVHSFQQNKYPRIEEDSLDPLEESKFGREAWYPPGHGDFYRCFYDQGLLDDLLAQGKEILFMSNADNLGATLDERILHYMLDQDVPFLMEMTAKTLADVKGGTLYDRDGRLRLLEVAQVPEEHLDEFCSLDRFKTFNTNNIWIHLKHLKKRLQDGPLDLELIVNRKNVQGTKVIQFETAIGSALDHFQGAKGLMVGRERFRPVKKTSDLFLIQSNLFTLDRGTLMRNPDRTRSELPVVTFDKPFTDIEEYETRIPAIPNLLELESLDLRGNVTIEPDVVLKGKVAIASNDKPFNISKGTVLENHSHKG